MMRTGTATSCPVFFMHADRRFMEKNETATVLRGVRKTIGRTTYVVSVHGNEKSRENVKNKDKYLVIDADAAER